MSDFGEPASPAGKPRRKRGVRLSDLDRSKVYRIGHTGRRWEVLGEDPDVRPEAPQDAPEGAPSEAGRTAGVLGRHRATPGLS